MLLVHGIFDTGARFTEMMKSLESKGFGPIVAIDLKPNDGSMQIEFLARQVARAAEELRKQAGTEQIDLIGFSMGALVSRYYVQRLEGHTRVRRFISISGPHHGTKVAYLTENVGGLQMRPDSLLLTKLEADPDPFGKVEVSCFYTPYDLMIVPATSSLLSKARETRQFPVLMHHLMLTDPAVIAAVDEALLRP